MALFSKKNKREEEREKKIESTDSTSALRVSRKSDHVLARPRVTEKATEKSTNESVYVFEIDPRAGKRDVIRAIAEVYKVHPKKVNIVPIPRKKIFVRGKLGMKSGGKKAYVYLRPGDKIEIV